LYFILYPLIVSACDPNMWSKPGTVVTTTSVDWWMHLLSNLPAMLFLHAFSVLVYTFARIYHKVLLAGVWFQARRFHMLTVVLVLLNVVALIATFGDWVSELESHSNTLTAFVAMLTYCVTGVCGTRHSAAAAATMVLRR